MIGFFDSGVGGLTIIDAVHQVLPTYDTLYLGDSANAPYGSKEHHDLVHHTWNGVRWLLAHGCELVIIACNTASTTALREIQQTRLADYPQQRVLGIIRPTVEELATRGFKKIVVLATPAAAASGAYAREFEKENSTIEVHVHDCERWAPMIEDGLVGTEEMQQEIRREIKNLEREVSNYDAVLLACTHYAYVAGDVEATLSIPVPVFKQGDIVARSLQEYLLRHPEIERALTRNAHRRYFTTGDPALASMIASNRFGVTVAFNAAVIPLSVS